VEAAADPAAGWARLAAVTRAGLARRGLGEDTDAARRRALDALVATDQHAVAPVRDQSTGAFRVDPRWVGERHKL
jgi:hypothetical protein